MDFMELTARMIAARPDFPDGVTATTDPWYGELDEGSRGCYLGLRFTVHKGERGITATVSDKALRSMGPTILRGAWGLALGALLRDAA